MFAINNWSNQRKCARARRDAWEERCNHMDIKDYKKEQAKFLQAKQEFEEIVNKRIPDDLVFYWWKIEECPYLKREQVVIKPNKFVLEPVPVVPVVPDSTNDSWLIFCSDEYYFQNILLKRQMEHFGTSLVHLQNTNCYTEGELGNTSQTPPKRINPSRFWLFTCFNMEQLENLKKISLDGGVEKMIVGKEVCETSQREHYQGFIEFKKRQRVIGSKIVGSINQVHWTRMSKNATVSQNYDYCTKEGCVVVNKGFHLEVPKVTRNMLNDKQKKIYDMFNNVTPTQNRIINYLYDKKGGFGKTLISLCFHDANPSDTLVVSGNPRDIYCGLKGHFEKYNSYPKYIIQDQPRGKRGFNGIALEKIKDGLIFSSKYESSSIRLPSVHVIVFSNFPPDTDRLSSDRWNIIDLNEL